MNNKYILLLCLALCGCVQDKCCTIPTDDIIKIYSSEVDTWKIQISQAFDEAEKEILNINPQPDDILKPDPDPSKCICKGTGIIIHGDDHKTLCPFHGNQLNQSKTSIKRLQ